MIERFGVEGGKTTFGMHLMLDAYGVRRELLADKEKVSVFLSDLPGKIGMRILDGPFVVEAKETNSGFDPGGWSGVVIIHESHISIHTFPLRGFFSLDVYSCSNFQTQVEQLMSHIGQAFPYKEEELVIIHRGRKYPVDDLHKK